MAQGMSASAPPPRTRRLLTQARPFDPVADVPERRPHTQRHQLVPRRPVRRPVRKQLHQIRVQPHGAGPPALRLPDQQSRRIPRVIQVPAIPARGPLRSAGQCATSSAPRCGPGAGYGTPARPEDVGPGRPSSNEGHPSWQNTPNRTLPKAATVINFAKPVPHPRAATLADLESNSAIDIQTPDPTVTLPTALKPNLHPQVLLQNRTKGQSVQLPTGYHS